MLFSVVFMFLYNSLSAYSSLNLNSGKFCLFYLVYLSPNFTLSLSVCLAGCLSVCPSVSLPVCLFFFSSPPPSFFFFFHLTWLFKRDAEQGRIKKYTYLSMHTYSRSKPQRGSSSVPPLRFLGGVQVGKDFFRGGPGASLN